MSSALLLPRRIEALIQNRIADHKALKKIIKEKDAGFLSALESSSSGEAKECQKEKEKEIRTRPKISPPSEFTENSVKNNDLLNAFADPYAYLNKKNQEITEKGNKEALEESESRSENKYLEASSFVLPRQYLGDCPPNIEGMSLFSIFWS